VESVSDLQETPGIKTRKMRGVVIALGLVLVVALLQTAHSKPLSAAERRTLLSYLKVCVVVTTELRNTDLHKSMLIRTT